MSAEFDGGYQQQNFNQQFSASFNHDLFSSNSSLLFSTTETTEGNGEIDQPESTQVKMELKEKIKLKCLERGTEMPTIEEMTRTELPKPRIKEEDPEVIKKRRERNKIAAMKCRRLKRERIEKLEKRTNKLQESNRKMQLEKENLRREYLLLSTFLRNHSCSRNPNGISVGTWNTSSCGEQVQPDPDVLMYLNVEQ